MKNPNELLNEFLKGDKPIDDILSTQKPIVENKIEEPKQNSIVEDVKPIVESKPIENKIVVEKEIIYTEKLIPELKHIQDDIEMLKELLVEIMNKTLSSDKLLQEKLKQPTNSRKKIILNRDESGKIISAESVEIKDEV
jgi:hypothetical protein